MVGETTVLPSLIETEPRLHPGPSALLGSEVPQLLVGAEKLFGAAMQEPDAAAAAEGLHESVKDGLLVVLARVIDLQGVGQDHHQLVAVQHLEVLGLQNLAVLHIELEDFDRAWARLPLRQDRVILAEYFAQRRLLALADIKAGELGAVCHSDVGRRQEFHLRDANERVQELARLEEARVLV